MCAIDERIYLWLKQCSTKHCITDTDTNLVNFSSLAFDIQHNRFNYFLPPAVSQIKDDKENDKDKGNKKTRIADQEKNNNLRVNWMLQADENWNSFSHKTIEGPTLSIGCRPCLKYHVRGICYTDCKHKKSHRVLNKDDSKLTTNFLKQLRIENAKED